VLVRSVSIAHEADVSAGALAAVGRLLEAVGVRYAVIGAHAVNAWLEPRFTADIDVTVAADATDLARIKAALAGEGYVLAREHGADLPSGPDFLRFVSPDTTTTIELQLAKTDLQRAVIDRAVTASGTARVATVEDLIVLKLIANRPKDRVDLEGLVRLPDVDWAYVERWASEWQLSELLRMLHHG
jgi:hypothetical protein